MAKVRATSKTNATKKRTASKKKTPAAYRLLLVGYNVHPDHDDDTLIGLLAKRGAEVSRELGGDFVAAIVGEIPDPADSVDAYEDEEDEGDEEDYDADDDEDEEADALQQLMESADFLILPHLGELEVSRLLAGDDHALVIQQHKMSRRLVKLLEAEPVALDALRALAAEPGAEEVFVRYDALAQAPSLAAFEVIAEQCTSLRGDERYQPPLLSVVDKLAFTPAEKVRAIEVLLAKGARVDDASMKLTALHIALSGSRMANQEPAGAAVVEALLAARDISPSTKTSALRYGLTRWCAENRAGIAALVRSMDVNHVEPGKPPALFAAAHAADSEAIRMLVDAQANVSAVHSEAYTVDNQTFDVSVEIPADKTPVEAIELLASAYTTKQRKLAKQAKNAQLAQDLQAVVERITANLATLRELSSPTD